MSSGVSNIWACIRPKPPRWAAGLFETPARQTDAALNANRCRPAPETAPEAGRRHRARRGGGRRSNLRRWIPPRAPSTTTSPRCASAPGSNSSTPMAIPVDASCLVLADHGTLPVRQPARQPRRRHRPHAPRPACRYRRSPRVARTRISLSTVPGRPWHAACVATVCVTHAWRATHEPRIRNSVARRANGSPRPCPSWTA